MIIIIYICVRYTTVDDALSLNLLQGSLCLSKIIDYKIVCLHVFVCLVC